ncbi:MAG TPA: amino acid adenylation domain-containing protein [Pyrinomonadaceae bacterium]|nr:amino acid adenylation domain-containing protein [Pyrinomonadaceae bacterium]
MSYESVQEMFSRTAEKYGSRVAIERGGQHVSYAALEAQSNRLANFLLDHGVSSGTMVGLFTANPIQIITGILGVLKAGGVFVPLDPRFPEHRLRVMSERVQPGWYVTEQKHAAKLAQVWSGTDARVICVDGPADESGEANLDREYTQYDRKERPGAASDPDAPCSIYFTSGSTGKPKAILGRLKGIDHFMRWEIETVGVTAGTRVSQLASPSFDGFLKDAFVPLCAGGVVCAPESRDMILDAWSLADWLDVEQIEVLHCVPSVFRSLLNERLNQRYFEALRCVVMTGEPLYPVDVKRWMDVFGDRVRLLNIYGTTETSLSKFHYEVKPADVDRPSIPVGKPIKGAAVMLVNPHGEPCGIGDVGEIYIRTPYRSHGYYCEPELTREVFIHNPFNNDPNDMVHKTGDYGRLLEDGNLEHLGRRDQQVQVRGVRVELGEIENLLRGHGEVSDVAVIDRDDAGGNKFLVAYVTMNNGTGSEQLRQYLAERLPETMLPSAFVKLDQLPRTLNGKIDRKALPSFESLQAGRDKEQSGPRGPLEEIVAGIWCEVLRLPAVLRTDDFFNLGGHSLLVTQVILRVREAFKVELPIRSLFEAPQLSQFAELIQEQISRGAQVDQSPVVRVARDRELPLSYAQQRMWFLDRLSGQGASFHVPMGLRIKGSLNKIALEQTFNEIVRRHENLRTVFPAVDDQPVQVIQAPYRLQLSLVDLSGLPAHERESCAARLAQQDAVRRFDLAHGPLLRLTLVDLDHDEHILICTLHHIISDGQSFEVVSAEMNRLYNAFDQGEQSPLAELSVQYVDYAAWQRQWLQGEVLETRLAYWRNQLQDAPRQLSLPQQSSRPRVQRFKAARQDVALSQELTERLRELSRREGVTLLMTMLSAFVLLLKKYTGDEDIVVGAPYANRERPEAQNLIGILINVLVLRVDLSGQLTFRETLRRVKDVCLDAYSNQLPPELLREDFVGSGKEGERLFDVYFQLEREEREKLEMRGLDCEPYIAGREETKFELSLMLVERNDEIRGLLEYDLELFDDDTMTEMVHSYIKLLEKMIADPDRRV